MAVKLFIHKEMTMFSVGHLAFGYLSGRASSKLLNVNVDISLLFLVSILPDVDLLVPGIEHRGLTHSIIILSLAFIPAFITYKERAVPYFIALVQHSLVGDSLTAGGVQMLWPTTTTWYGAKIEVASPTNISLEWILFLACLTVMLKTKDVWNLFRHHPSNLLLSIPVLTVLAPTFFSFPIPVPLRLVLPHLAYLTLFTLSILVDLKSGIKTA
jgi:membrane-bound metal-dependent hydrolase YbcI (DUF457 family)